MSMSQIRHWPHRRMLAEKKFGCRYPSVLLTKRLSHLIQIACWAIRYNARREINSSFHLTHDLPLAAIAIVTDRKQRMSSSESPRLRVNPSLMKAQQCAAGASVDKRLTVGISWNKLGVAAHRHPVQGPIAC